MASHFNLPEANNDSLRQGLSQRFPIYIEDSYEESFQAPQLGAQNEDPQNTRYSAQPVQVPIPLQALPYGYHPYAFPPASVGSYIGGPRYLVPFQASQHLSYRVPTLDPYAFAIPTETSPPFTGAPRPSSQLPWAPEQSHYIFRETHKLPSPSELAEKVAPEEEHSVHLPPSTSPARSTLKERKTMAPGYRAHTQSRRANRSYVDHDVFEGLPVRNWRRETITMAPPQAYEVPTSTDKWATELPWGMPKDSHLLPQHSQDLLRAARSGRLYMKRTNTEDEEFDGEPTMGDKPEKKEEEPKERGFSVKTWKLIPRHLEGPEIEVLAKRRKGLKGAAVVVNNGPTMTKASVRRTDSAGNTYVVDVVVAEGQAVEGEVISQTVISAPGVAGAAVDPTLLPSAPIRRRPPPPKRKAKGPGRGRKKKLLLPPTSVPADAGAGAVKVEDGQPAASGIQEATSTAEVSSNLRNPSLAVARLINILQGVKAEPATVSTTDAANANENEDAEMGDDSVLPSDDEGDDGSDDEEGDDQDEQDGDDQDGDEPEADTTGTDLERKMTDDSLESPSNDRHDHSTTRDSHADLPLPKMQLPAALDHGSAGSPLKHVMSYEPVYSEHSPNMGDSDGEAEADGDDDEGGDDQGQTDLDGASEAQHLHNPYISHDMERAISSHSAAAYGGQDGALDDNTGMPSMAHDESYQEGDDMILDADVSGMEFQDLHTHPGQYAEHEQYQDDHAEMPIEQQHMPSFDNEHTSGDHGYGAIEQPAHDIGDELQFDHGEHPAEQQEGEDGDTFEDLLGSLEDHLNDHDAPVADLGHASEATTEQAEINEEIAAGEALVAESGAVSTAEDGHHGTEAGAAVVEETPAVAEDAELDA
jgi:hypothetical protein